MVPDNARMDVPDQEDATGLFAEEEVSNEIFHQ